MELNTYGCGQNTVLYHVKSGSDNFSEANPSVKADSARDKYGYKMGSL